MSIHGGLKAELASWKRRVEYLQREAAEWSRAGFEDDAKIYRTGADVAAEHVERLSNRKMELEGLRHALGNSEGLQF
jgi:hypothetical protein